MFGQNRTFARPETQKSAKNIAPNCCFADRAYRLAAVSRPSTRTNFHAISIRKGKGNCFRIFPHPTKVQQSHAGPENRPNMTRSKLLTVVTKKKIQFLFLIIHASLTLDYLQTKELRTWRKCRPGIARPDLKVTPKVVDKADKKRRI